MYIKLYGPHSPLFHALFGGRKNISPRLRSAEMWILIIMYKLVFVFRAII